MRLWYAGVGRNIYCYLSHAGTIRNSTISAFIEIGASFNTVDPRVIERLSLPVVECAKPPKLSIGNTQQVIIPRRVSQLRVKLHEFPEYTTDTFVMSVPEDRHILLGMPWLHEVNPRVYWHYMVINARCRFARVCKVVAKTVDGARKTSTCGKSHHPPSHDDVMLYNAKHTNASVAGPTCLISSRQLRQLKTSDSEFSFFLQATDKAVRQQATDWDALEGHPVQQVALKYKDAGLPLTPPTRTIDIEVQDRAERFFASRAQTFLTP
ncbi:hypothetical protein CCR75_000422 [Bremia lactucae]|uniref:Uncharacterized protein n=1 Tax=Bremia lactucae TaxID=4779 RepID=A0A976FIN0_BRELC|nr:hypothetical protein CCR75_000422 [Bremia lactucae]